MNTNDKRNITLIYAVRNKHEALFIDKIRDRVDQIIGLSIILLKYDYGQLACVDKINIYLSEI